MEESKGRSSKGAPVSGLPHTSRRRKGTVILSQVIILFSRALGPAFLPSEHDELPHGVAFMVRLHDITRQDE